MNKPTGNDVSKFIGKTVLDTMCKAQELKSIQRSIANAVPGVPAETFSVYFAVCPYCGSPTERIAPSITPEMYIEGKHLVACKKCKHAYIMQTNITYSWETYRTDEVNPSEF